MIELYTGIEGLMLADELLNETKSKFTKMDEVAFLSLLGVMVDTWSAVHDEDPVSLFESVLNVCRQVNAQLGPMVV